MTRRSSQLGSRHANSKHPIPDWICAPLVSGELMEIEFARKSVLIPRVENLEIVLSAEIILHGKESEIRRAWIR